MSIRKQYMKPLNSGQTEPLVLDSKSLNQWVFACLKNVTYKIFT